MRTTQDRINLIINYFGADRIQSHIDNEDMFFCKGRAVAVSRNEVRDVAEFAFCPTPYESFNHSFYNKDVTKFKTPFKTIENDETQRLQVWITVYDNMFRFQSEREDKQMFAHNAPILKALGSTGGAHMERFFINHCVEEFEGVINHCYEVMVYIGGYGNTSFKTKTPDLATDELFIASVQDFANKFCKQELSIDELKKDLIGSISKLSLHEDVFKLDFDRSV